MKEAINLQKLCNALRHCEERNDDDVLFDTAGKRYLMEQVFPSLVFDRPLMVRDVDLDAFDEEDIVDLIDYRSNELDVHFCFASRMAKCFQESEALATRQPKFF